MSNLILTEAWQLQGISATQKLVLVSLADQANDEGVCWPSVGSVSKRTCLCDKAIRNAISDLKSLGHLSIKKRLGTSSFYQIHIKPSPVSDTKGGRYEVPEGSVPDTEGVGTTYRQTINNHKEPKEVNEEGKPSSKTQPIEIDTFVKQRESSGLMVSEESDPVWRTAETLGLPTEFVRLAWQYLLSQYSREKGGKPKRYAQWPLVLNNCVQNRWGNLWFRADDGSYQLTQNGKQLWQLMEANHD